MLLDVKNLSQLQQKRIDITTNKIICIVGLNVTQTINMYRTYADINAHFPNHSSSVLIVEKYSNLKAGWQLTRKYTKEHRSNM